MKISGAIVDLRPFRRPAGAKEVNKVFDEVCMKYQTTRTEVCGRAQFAFMVKARQEICYRLYREAGLSTGQIAALFGRHHTTIINSVRRERAFRQLNKLTQVDRGTL